jgi:hypothetical protein
MILSRRSLLLILLVLCTAALIYLGIRGYFSLRDISLITQEQAKLSSESFLFIAILLTLLVQAGFWTVLLRSRSVSKELDKVTEMARMGNFTPSESLRKLGTLGEKIRNLYYRLNELNEMKSIKISSLSAINSFLLINSEMSLLLADPTGRVVEASRVFVERSKQPRTETLGKFLVDIIRDLDFKGLVARLERDRSLTTDSDAKGASFFPVFNRNSQLSFIVSVLGRETIHTPRDSLREGARAKSRRAGVMRKMLTPRRGRLG